MEERYRPGRIDAKTARKARRENAVEVKVEGLTVRGVVKAAKDEYSGDFVTLTPDAKKGRDWDKYPNLVMGIRLDGDRQGLISASVLLGDGLDGGDIAFVTAAKAKSLIVGSFGMPVMPDAYERLRSRKNEIAAFVNGLAVQLRNGPQAATANRTIATHLSAMSTAIRKESFQSQLG